MRGQGYKPCVRRQWPFTTTTSISHDYLRLLKKTFLSLPIMTSINASHISEAAHRDALRFPHTGQVNLKDISEGTYLTPASRSHN